MTPSDTRLASRRRAIHAAARQIGLTEEERRDLIAGQTGGKRSTTDLDLHECERVLNRMRQLGAARPDGVSRTLDSSPEGRKARALWLWLHGIGIVRDPSEAALTAFARRISRVEALQWAQLDKVIEGLKIWAARQLPSRIDARIARLAAAGLVRADLTALGLASLVSPRLNPARFDALRAAWEHLDAVEAEERAG